MAETIPIATTWSLFALGAARGRRARRPRDPVAAWLLAQDPDLSPGVTPGSVLAMMRVRQELVEQVLADCISPRREVVAVASGFDGRWARWHDRVARWTEVDLAAVIDHKDRLLAGSVHAPAWDRVGRVRQRPDQWRGPVPVDAVVVAEGLATRSGPDAVRGLLSAVAGVPGVRVVFDLPGFTDSIVQRPSRWRPARSTAAAGIGTRELIDAGWRVEAELWQAARPEVRGPGGVVYAPGVEALRVVRVRWAVADDG